MQTNKGYVVSRKLLPALLEQLETRGVEYQVVESPDHFDEYPRPVLVTDGPKPKGWTRFGMCRRCKVHPSELPKDSARADWATWCKSCQKAKDHGDYFSEEYLWRCIEKSYPVSVLDLQYLDQLDVLSVADVREALQEGELNSVGPERTIEVAQALEKFRVRIISVFSC